PAKNHQPIGSSRMTFCAASWGALKPSSSIRCLVPSAALPIRAWMGWPLVIEYFVFCTCLIRRPSSHIPSWLVREALALPLASRTLPSVRGGRPPYACHSLERINVDHTSQAPIGATLQLSARVKGI